MFFRSVFSFLLVCGNIQKLFLLLSIAFFWVNRKPEAKNWKKRENTFVRHVFLIKKNTVYDKYKKKKVNFD